MKCHDCKKVLKDDEMVWTFVGKKRDISFGQLASNKKPAKLEKETWRCRDCHLKANGERK